MVGSAGTLLLVHLPGEYPELPLHPSGYGTMVHLRHLTGDGIALSLSSVVSGIVSESLLLPSISVEPGAPELLLGNFKLLPSLFFFCFSFVWMIIQ